ncbi:MAG: DUF4411 domain-containing protein [Bacteroidetes bacterium HGW-Bacteroidetes-3]|nr:MAG: DUF4411 domain-containing protein [Bacteroidetes bacterium HGW-Bacteroidetes-3]
MSVYVVDSNFFIQAHRVIYPLDVAISFWVRVKQLAENGNIVSIDKVKNEIYQNDDDLKTWCQNNLPVDFFKDSTDVISEYTAVVAWTMSKNGHYQQRAVDEFMDANEADAWIVAYSLKHNCTITTYERSQPERKSKIKIPEPCDSLGLTYLDTISMFRILGVQF